MFMLFEIDPKTFQCMWTIWRGCVRVCWCLRAFGDVCHDACRFLQFLLRIFNSMLLCVCPRSLRAMSKENKRPRSNGEEVQRANVIKLNVGGKDYPRKRGASANGLGAPMPPSPAIPPRASRLTPEAPGRQTHPPFTWLEGPKISRLFSAGWFSCSLSLCHLALLVTWFGGLGTSLAVGLGASVHYTSHHEKVVPFK